MKLNFNFRSFPWIPTYLFLFLTASILTAGYIHYQLQKDKIINEIQNELAVIVNLKIEKIVQWRNDYLADGKFISNNQHFVHQVETVFKNHGDTSTSLELITLMKSAQTSLEYTNVILCDLHGITRLSAVQARDSLGECTRRLIFDVIHHHRFIFSDLYKEEGSAKINMDLVMPIVKRDNQDSVLLGVLLLRFDPEKILFPIIQSWPTQSRTAETLLLRSEGDSVLFLNKLRHYSNAPLMFRLPISHRQLPASMAASGFEGKTEGIDYRNVPVLASMQRIPNSPWFMVAKVDQEEIYTPFREQMTLIMLSVVLFILVVALTLGLWWKHQRAKHYKQQSHLEQERQALISHIDYLFKYANDIIIFTNKDLNIIEASDRALEAYGCTRNELIGLNMVKLRAQETAAQLPELIRSLDEVKTAFYETIHQRKDGSTFPIEVSARLIEIEGNKFYQTIGRDITERKRAEELLHVDEEYFRAIFENNSAAIAIIEQDTTFSMVNDAFCQMSGYTKQEVIGMSWTKLIPQGDLERLKEYNRRRLINPKDAPEKYEFMFFHKNGKLGYGLMSIAMIQNNGKIVASFTEITERKWAEEQLQKSTEQIRAMFQTITDGIVFTDLQGIIISLNDAAIRMNGYKEKEDLIGKSALELIAENDKTRAAQNLQKVLEFGYSGILEYKFKMKNGDEFDAELNSVLLRDNKGNPAGFVAFTRDITKRKQAEEALRESEERYRTLFENAQIGIYRTTLEGKIIAANPALIQMLGYNSFDELAAINVEKEGYAPSTPRHRFKEMIERHGEIKGLENEWIKRDNSVISVSENARAIHGEGGVILYYEGTVEDITERKRAEEKLRESEERYRCLVEVSPDVVVVYSNGKFAYVNPAGVKLIHAHDESELIGKSVLDIVHPDYKDFVRQRVVAAMEQGTPQHMEEEKYLCFDGTVVDVEVVSVPTMFKGMPAIQAVARDVTERRKAEEKIKQLNEELEQRVKDRTVQLEVANKELESFAYSVSHDLRAPLRGIDGWSLALKEDFHEQLSDQARQDLNRIRSETQRMEQLIDDLLKLSQVTRAEMEPMFTDLTAMAHSIIARMQNNIVNRKINFIIQPDLSAWCDTNLLNVVLTNLFENACKFTSPREQAQIEFGKTDVDGEQVFFIRDNGVGFDMNYAKNLFGAFQRMHRLTDFPGTGIGLATVQRIIHRHGGRVWADAHLDSGATFYFTLKEGHE